MEAEKNIICHFPASASRAEKMLSTLLWEDEVSLGVYKNDGKSFSLQRFCKEMKILLRQLRICHVTFQLSYPYSQCGNWRRSPENCTKSSGASEHGSFWCFQFTKIGFLIKYEGKENSKNLKFFLQYNTLIGIRYIDELMLKQWWW